MDDIYDTVKLIEDYENEKASYMYMPFQRANSSSLLPQTSRTSNNSLVWRNELVTTQKSVDNNREGRLQGGSENRRFIPCRHSEERYFTSHQCKNQKFTCLELE